ncbi:arylalkylamine N-acetyltransferase 1-like [Oratosquilla oratoria]|uniref:arylalkylamine N-acetyltransferase 1-like n=1 Tax=Oratosquilla oratoria TaxID=337810 RepID=UPI003F76F711
MDTNFSGLYNSVTSCFRKYAAVATRRKPEERGEAEGGAAVATHQEEQPTTPSVVEENLKTQSPRPSLTQGDEAAKELLKGDGQLMQGDEEPEVPELPEKAVLPPDVLYMHDGGIAFKILTLEYADQAVDLLCNHFFKDEPLGRALYLESPREVDHWLSKVLPHMISHGVSIMAVDENNDGKLVGVAVNSVKTRGDPPGPDDFLAWIEPDKDPKMYKIISFLTKLASDIDFFSTYSVNRVFNFDLLNVEKSYGGRGIASMLVQQSVNVAKEKGFSCLTVETTGIFSAKIFSRHGFKTIREVPYSSYRENGYIVFPNTGIHTSARVSVRMID